MAFKTCVVFTGLLAAIGCGSSERLAPEPEPEPQAIKPAIPQALVLAGGGWQSNNAPGGGFYSYQGGPVLNGIIKVVAIYWNSTTIYNGGPAPNTTGAGSADLSKVGHFLRNLGATPWWGLTNQYPDNFGHRPSGLNYAAYWADSRAIPNPSNFDPNQPEDELDWGIANGKVPAPDGNTVYVFFMGPGLVTDSPSGGFFGTEKQYGKPGPDGQCGYHYSHNGIPYAVLGYPSMATSCGASDLSPLADPVAASQASPIAHELAEAATDPFPNGSKGYYGPAEPADNCAGIYAPGEHTSTMDGGRATMNVGGIDFHFQSMAPNVSPLTCTDRAINTVTLSTPVVTKGFQSPIAATCSPSWGSWVCPVTWFSNNYAVANVTPGPGGPNQATVTGVAGGSATITACSYTVCGLTQIVPVDPLTGVAISGRIQIKPNATCRWTASVSSGTAPYTYQWGANLITGSQQADGSFVGTASSQPGAGSVTVYAKDATGVQGSKVLSVTISASAPVCPI